MRMGNRAKGAIQAVRRAPVDRAVHKDRRWPNQHFLATVSLFGYLNAGLKLFDLGLQLRNSFRICSWPASTDPVFAAAGCCCYIPADLILPAGCEACRWTAFDLSS